MDINQLLLLAIIILLGVIIVFGIYFAITYFNNRKSNKKIDTIFNPSSLVEENSLMNMMDEKRNIDFNKNEEKKTDNSFITEESKVEIQTSDVMKNEGPINPFSVDLTRKVDEKTDDSTQEEINNNNKFFK